MVMSGSNLNFCFLKGSGGRLSTRRVGEDYAFDHGAQVNILNIISRLFLRFVVFHSTQ